MNGLDLFSGIGGITKALEGYVRPIAYCEIEPYARAVLLSRMFSGDIPTAPIWDDVSSLRGAMLPKVDIIYGGFPCQDISTAGRGKGLAGERSGLFFEIMRLAEEIKPAFIFLENVANIRCKGLNIVIREMDRLGYDCRWGILSAADVGANHKRERWFLLAYSDGDGSRLWGAERQRQHGRGASVFTSGELAHPDSQSQLRLSRREKEKEFSFGTNGEPSGGHSWWATEPNVGRVAHGISKRVDRLRALGNAVCPLQARTAFERLIGIKK